MENVNSQFLLSIFIIAIGYVSRRLNIITDKDGDGLSRIVINIILPAAVINAFSGITLDTSQLLLPLINIAFGSLMTLAGWYFFRKEGRETRGMLCMLFPGLNIGLFAYPLVEAILGKDGLKCFAMFDTGNAFMVFGVSYLIASSFSAREGTVSLKAAFSKISRSVPLLTYIITLIVKLSGLSFPKPVLEISSVLAKANMPMSLLTLGIFLSFTFEKSDWRNMGKVLFIRYAAGLAVGTLLFMAVPGDMNFRLTLLIGPILPISLATVPYAVEFGYNRNFAGTINSLTIIISFTAMWLIFNLV